MRLAAITVFVLGATANSWLEVPFVRQTGAGCGAAAIAMVMQYWARQNPALSSAAAETERIDQYLPSNGKGIRGEALRAYLQAQGFDAFVFRGESSDLREQFQKGRPLVVCLGLNGPRGPFHYAVIAGVEPGAVWLNDPARGKLIRENPERFEAAWKLADHWTLLAVPRQTR